MLDNAFDETFQVLVVDDDLAIRETLRLVLEDDDYAVHTAQDGVEALELLRTIPSPLVVLLDYVMPRLSGLDVLRAIVADEQLAANRAFVLCTAMSSSLPDELQGLCATLGAPLLAKPFDLQALLDAVAHAGRGLRDLLPASHASEASPVPVEASLTHDHPLIE